MSTDVKSMYQESLRNTHAAEKQGLTQMETQVKGLDDFEKHPPVAPVFYAFRVMVGVGMAMLAVS